MAGEAAFAATREALRGGGAVALGAAAGAPAADIVHVDISCDGCDKEPIVGARFKCLSCEDIDLCGGCMRALVAARVKMSMEAGPPPAAPPATDSAVRRPRRWAAALHGDDARARWAALQAAVPCLHPSHGFRRVDGGPERALTLALSGAADAADGEAAALEALLRRFPPSRCACADLAWVVVDFPARAAAAAAAGAALERRIDAALAEFEAPRAAGRRPSAADVAALARRHRLRRGKWMAFAAAGAEADAAWAAAARAALEGRPLAAASEVKVSSAAPGKDHVIAVYIEDSLDAAAVQAAGAALAAALPPLARPQLLFKPDIYTHLGVYASNDLGLKPTTAEARAREAPRRWGRGGGGGDAAGGGDRAPPR
jgi:hypothetical protein